MGAVRQNQTATLTASRWREQLVIEQEIDLRIAEALGGRRNQLSFVAELTSVWHAMVDGFDQLVTVLADVEKADPTDNGVARLLHGTGDGMNRVDGLRLRIAAAQLQLDAVSARVHRDTVNIGVVGATKVGKSTLLRTVTDLPVTVIPTTQFNPTTASASRIYHTAGEPTATLDLHTWQSFRDSYLAPLHEAAGLGPVPADAATFTDHRYPAPGSAAAGATEADDYLRKLDAAHRSFASYRHLLEGPARALVVDFAALRPYVAYPDLDAGDPADVQPFHAVRSVRVEKAFVERSVSKLGLIDLPGAGEAGLDIDRHFLARVKNEIDLLLMVKRGDRRSATYVAEDAYARNLADSARGGVALDDYYMVLVNRDEANDPTGEYFENTVKKVTEVSRERGIRVLAADVIRRDEVFAEVVRPVLVHLAGRLAEMDRAAVRQALALATEVAGEVTTYAEDALRTARERALLLPDQEDEFRDLAEELRDDLAHDLAVLVDHYDGDLADGAADAALSAAISDAVDVARGWVRDGLGRGSRDQWMKEIKGRYVAGSLEAKQDQYYRAKTEITEIFSRIDVSLERSVRRLWEDVAQVLRGRLTDDLVPPGPAALDELRSTAESRRALILADALRQLRQLKADYGSVVLRVTRPVIRGVHWDRVPSVGTAVPAVSAQRATPAQARATTAAPAPAGSRWVRNADGSLRRGSAPVSDPAPRTPPPPVAAVDPATTRAPVTAVGGREEESAKRGAEVLYDELSAAVERCVTDLETALREEGRVMSRTLAAAADRFFDSVIRTNRSERDYEYLCRPNQRSIWPDKFDGGTALLAADLSRAQEQARLALAATAAVTGLFAGLRLRPLTEPT
ncbi:hypothetical protein [Asanoa siamensis]|uniref:Dynamin family protein n=1 Tax=Asanoa siamensis TaxID=926357 RepID=A0ABQ4CRL8_9ACTN|nr:hypothetical protein [Asanoa siamensis]GIF73925.1 hypothetical protein Asi02nite_34430 [Asanoa siamensis]